MIPNVIHQIWFQGKRHIPQHLLYFHQSWKDMNPEYKMIVWDRPMIERLVRKLSIETDNKWLYDLYHSYQKIIQRINIAKYVILYYHGGIYIDMDVQCLQPLSKLEALHSNPDLVLSTLVEHRIQKILLSSVKHPLEDPIINNGIIMSCPKHPVLFQALIEAKTKPYTNMKWISSMLYVFYTTGPLCLARAVSKVKQTISDEKIIILPPIYFESCKIDIHCNPHPDAIGVHLFESSWIEGTDRLFMNLYVYRKIVYTILAILFIVFGGIFTYKMLRNKKSVFTEASVTEVSATEASSTDPASATDITIITDPSSQYRELMDSVSLDSLSEQSLDDGDLLSMISESSELP